MTQQTLEQKFNTLSDEKILEEDIPSGIINNLAEKMIFRPYQEEAMRRYLYYIDKYKQRIKPTQILFHMATGSGKTLMMAALIIELYKRGYRNFLFFVNSSQIIEKTKDNFLNLSSEKYLFAQQIRIDEKPVEIYSVENFEAANPDAINIHFTTIQGLHSRINTPRENAVTLEDFKNYKVVMISDEAHHLNAETKQKLNKKETERKVGWESTVTNIFNQNLENILLEFTATVDMEHPAINAKYCDKILYAYPLSEFRKDGYSKDIELRQADLQPDMRMLQAMVLSQYRRKVAARHEIQCKPVILMKSLTIDESKNNEQTFNKMMQELTAKTIENLRAKSEDDETLKSAFEFIFDDNPMTPEEFVLEIKEDFSPEKVINVNEDKRLEELQIELNNLESRDNEIRVIFAVNKLDEGWDVLNLFDIVRLYETRDSGKTTISEAQLIGRGARYFPFIAPDLPEQPKEKRKYDNNLEDPLRILEELHYHCAHNPKYISEIKIALRETGMLDDEDAEKVTVRLKKEFKESEFYQKEHVWLNERKKNAREKMNSLKAYNSDGDFTTLSLKTGTVTEMAAFDDETPSTRKSAKEAEKDLKLTDFPKQIIRFALDGNDFFHFANLKEYFPNLKGINEFIESEKYLGSVKTPVRALQSDLDNLTAKEKLEITSSTLRQIEEKIKAESIEYIGTKEFTPHLIKDLFNDETTKLGRGESAKSWEESTIAGLDLIDLANLGWHVYETSYGTSEEKLFIKFLSEKSEEISKIYKRFYLLRNERAVKIYAFDDGRAFEPDFLLFLQKQPKGKSTVLQIFIEPKGDHIADGERWKENFLKDIKSKHKLKVMFENKEYIIYGMPFFNEKRETREQFEEDFEKFL